MIGYALHLRYSSLQAHSLFFEKIPMPYLSLLNIFQQGGVYALKALKTLFEKCSFSRGCLLVIDKMHLQKSPKYQSDGYVGVDEEGNLYKGIVVFMVVGLKQSIPFVVQAIPEVTFKGQWLIDTNSSY